MNQYPILAIIIPLLAGFATPIVGKISSYLRNVVCILAIGTQVALVSVIFLDVIKNGIVTYTIGAQIPTPSGASVPVRIILNIDALGAFMGLIFSAIALIAIIYSFNFFKKQDDDKDGYYTLLSILAGAGLGLAFTGDLFNLFVFLELTSLSAVGLIAFRGGDARPSEAGFKFLVISSVAAWMFLVATGFLYGKYDALNIALLSERMTFGVVDKISLLLFIGSLGLKFGIVPMHMWVPDAYGESPAPISMVLVALSQLSLYAFIRIVFTLFGPSVEVGIGWTVIGLALLTMFVGATMAILQDRMKRLIAYSAVSQVGYMLLGVGVALVTINQSEAININHFGFKALQGGLYHIINDAVVMALLFVVAGVVVRQVGEEDLNSLGGLARKMPFTSAVFLIGGAAVAGIPPLNGFASKFIIYESVFKLNPFLTALALLVSIFTMAIYVKAFQGAFLGPKLKKFEGVQDAQSHVKALMIVLVLLIILLGLFPDLVINEVIRPVASAVLNHQQYIRGIL